MNFIAHKIEISLLLFHRLSNPPLISSAPLSLCLERSLVMFVRLSLALIFAGEDETEIQSNIEDAVQKPRNLGKTSLQETQSSKSPLSESKADGLCSTVQFRGKCIRIIE